MANGAYVGRRVAEELQRHGESMTLTRQGGPSVAVKGKRHRPQGTTGDIVAAMANQATLRIMVSNTEIAAAAWPGPPKNGDLLVIGAKPYRLVDDADTRMHDGVTLCHFITVKGGP